MTYDELFVNTAKHLAQQTKRSISETGNCLYAGPDGNACGIGCHLPRKLCEELDKANEVGAQGSSWESIASIAADADMKDRYDNEERKALRVACREAVALLYAFSVDVLSRIQATHDGEAKRTPKAKIGMLKNLLHFGGLLISDAAREEMNQLSEELRAQEAVNK